MLRPKDYIDYWKSLIDKGVNIVEKKKEKKKTAKEASRYMDVYKWLKEEEDTSDLEKESVIKEALLNAEKNLQKRNVYLISKKQEEEK